jgi:DNA-binding protein HU-beta
MTGRRGSPRTIQLSWNLPDLSKIARPGRARPPLYPSSPNTRWAPQVKLSLQKIPLNSTDFLLPSPDRILRNVAAMNKAELIESIQVALGKDATKRAADEALEAVLSSIAKGVKKDNKVQIIGFGTFEVKKRAARQGRNPKTGEAMKIAASKSVGFKPSSVLKGSL